MDASKVLSKVETSKPSGAADAPKASLGALRHRDFRILWMAVLISNVGTWMHIVAQGWLMYQLTNSAFWLGLVGLMRAVPLLGFPLIGATISCEARESSERNPTGAPRFQQCRRDNGFVDDSPLEERRFEPSVPLVREEPREKSNEAISGSLVVAARNRRFESISLPGRVCEPSAPQQRTP